MACTGQGHSVLRFLTVELALLFRSKKGPFLCPQFLCPTRAWS
jgi:hypothetical protein